MLEARLIAVIWMLFPLVCFNFQVAFGEQQQPMNNSITGNKNSLMGENRDAKCTWAIIEDKMLSCIEAVRQSVLQTATTKEYVKSVTYLHNIMYFF